MPGHVNVLVVQRCGNYGQADLVVWAVGSKSTRDTDGLPGRVNYGERMPQFETTVSPLPLGPGTYIAFTDGSGAVHFAVRDNGDVVRLEHCTRPIVAGASIAQQAPTPCAAPLPEAAGLHVQAVDSAAAARARTILRRYPADVITSSPSRDSLERAIDEALLRDVGPELDRVLFDVIVHGSPPTEGGPHNLASAAPHFYVRLGLPKPPLEDLLISDELTPRTRWAVFWELSMTQEEQRTVGRGRMTIVCQLARRLAAGKLRGAERMLFATTVPILESQGRRGNTGAALLLEDPIVKAARSRL